MRNIAKGDVSKLCEHTRELIYELNAAGETTNDLLSNLIEALQTTNTVVTILLTDGTFELNKKYFALWIISMYRNKHTRQKSLKKYMKFW